jgi:hypothetical protein
MKRPKMKYKRSFKILRQEMAQIDYWDQLGAEEKEYLVRFLFEYYQGDFDGEHDLHPEELQKECKDRHNASRRQIHSVGGNLLVESAATARKRSTTKSGKPSNRAYTPEDYMPDQLEKYVSESEDVLVELIDLAREEEKKSNVKRIKNFT